MCVCVCVCVCSVVWLFVTPWTVAHQASQSMGFLRQWYWSRLPFPLPGIFLTQGSNPHLSCFPRWQADSLPPCHLAILSNYRPQHSCPVWCLPALILDLTLWFFFDCETCLVNGTLAIMTQSTIQWGLVSSANQSLWRILLPYWWHGVQSTANTNCQIYV